MNNDYNSNGQLYMFDQSPYCFGNGATDCRRDARMYDYGYIYIPTKCLTEKCKTHIWWHGCGGTAGLDNNQSKVMRGTAHLEHASANEFIAIFPQAWDPVQGWSHCWNSGLTQNRDHPQLMAIRRMLHSMYGEDLLDTDHPIPYTPSMMAEMEETEVLAESTATVEDLLDMMHDIDVESYLV